MGVCYKVDDEWEWYIGELYTKLINNCYKGQLNTVVEFAPGFRYKIANALSNVGFSGTIYVIDSNESVLKYIYKKYSEILPNAKVVCLNKDLEESIDFLPKNIDLFLANHSIDDMIISKYLEDKKLEDAFNNTEKSKDILVSCWNELKEEDELLFNLKERVFNELKGFFDSIKCKFIIMSQYKSGYYMKHRNYAEELSKTVFDKLKKIIDTNINSLDKALSFDFENFDVALNEGFSLKENIQYIDNWIAGAYKG